MVGYAWVGPLCLLVLNFCSRLGSAANSLERRGYSNVKAKLQTPVAPPEGQAVRVIQSDIEQLKQGKKLTTYVVYETQKTLDLHIPGTQRMRDDASKALNEWKTRNESFVLREKGELYTTEKFRLDLQGKIVKNGVVFANLQLQINKEKGKAVPKTSSVAQVNIEVGTVEKRMRGLEGMANMREVYYAATALDASLRQGRKTWVFQELTDANGLLLRRNP